MIVFDNRVLVPAAWREAADGKAVRIFNPGLLRDGSGWLLAYRVVIEPTLERRIAACRLDEAFNLIAGSIVPLSDLLCLENPDQYPAQARGWFADPRLHRFGGRVFLYWNSGWHEPQNCQFLQELDAITLQPLGTARELTLRGTRQRLEKNWALFEAGGLFAVYSVNPHRVLQFSLHGHGPIECADLAPPKPNPGGFAQVNGGLRGGAPPQRHGDAFYSFCHSIENVPSGYCYVPAVYRFAAQAPFHPTHMPTSPLIVEVPTGARRALAKLNPAINEVLYPAGAAYAEGKWIVSLGVDDERCGLAILDAAAVDATLAPTI